MDRISCKMCPPDQNTKGENCESCLMHGYVPNVDQSECIPCLSNEIAINGTCHSCKNAGQIYSALNCYYEVLCILIYVATGHSKYLYYAHGTDRRMAFLEKPSGYTFNFLVGIVETTSCRKDSSASHLICYLSPDKVFP